LTRNVTKEHVIEIFSTYGIIKSVDMPHDRIHPHLSRGFAYVEFDKPEDTEKAIKYMDGGQVDGQEVSATAVLTPKPQRQAGGFGGGGGGPAAMRHARGPPGGWRRSPPRGGGRRGGGRSPPRFARRRTRSRSRSRSPVRRRRESSSSSSR